MPTCRRIAHLRELNANRGHVVYFTACVQLLRSLRIGLCTALLTGGNWLDICAGLSFYSNDCNLLKAFFEGRWPQALCHLLHDLIGDGTLSFAVPLHAYDERHIEEDGLHLVAEAFGHFDPLPALVRREIRRIYIVPRHLRNQRTEGWVTAEYAMLPRSTHTRSQRELGRGPSGRTHEIQRLIGRSLRAIVNRKLIGERTITLDCDVLQADGGTRTAAITGAYVALSIACKRLMKERKIAKSPIVGEVAAISVGIVEGTPLLDLKYDEDSRAEVDMNIVCTGDGRFIEVQGTAEGLPFTREQMDNLLELGRAGIAELIVLQRRAIEASQT